MSSTFSQSTRSFTVVEPYYEDRIWSSELNRFIPDPAKVEDGTIRYERYERNITRTVEFSNGFANQPVVTVNDLPMYEDYEYGESSIETKQRDLNPRFFFQQPEDGPITYQVNESYVPTFSERDNDSEASYRTLSEWANLTDAYRDYEPNIGTVNLRDYRMGTTEHNIQLSTYRPSVQGDVLMAIAAGKRAATKAYTIEGFEPAISLELYDPALLSKYHASLLNVYRDKQGRFRIGSIAIENLGTENARAKCTKYGCSFDIEFSSTWMNVPEVNIVRYMDVPDMERFSDDEEGYAAYDMHWNNAYYLGAMRLFTTTVIDHGNSCYGSKANTYSRSLYPQVKVTGFAPNGQRIVDTYYSTDSHGYYPTVPTQQELDLLNA